MSFIKNIFRKKENKIETNEDFWKWFQENERVFFSVINNNDDIQNKFLSKLFSKLGELNDGFYLLAGMYDKYTAELILTPEGVVKNIVFVEELIAIAPELPNWKFTALKPANDIKNVCIKMDGYEFTSDHISFYAIDNRDYPDEIDIVFVYNNFKEEDKAIIVNGIFIFIDNYLGELKSITSIDNAVVISKEHAEKELIPIEKLSSYLLWREAEFIEKYSAVLYNTEEDSYVGLEANLDNGKPLLAIVNSTLLEWDGKASHPWILKVEIPYDGKDNNGMPDGQTYEALNRFEDQIMLELKDFEGYLNVGRQTADSLRIIYFACKEFRKPSKVLNELINTDSNKLDIEFSIYKDKYWQSLEMFKSR